MKQKLYSVVRQTLDTSPIAGGVTVPLFPHLLKHPISRTSVGPHVTNIHHKVSAHDDEQEKIATQSFAGTNQTTASFVGE